jgi:hypothetical protein
MREHTGPESQPELAMLIGVLSPTSTPMPRFAGCKLLVSSRRTKKTPFHEDLKVVITRRTAMSLRLREI